MLTPHKLRSQGPAEEIDLDHPNKSSAVKTSRFDAETELAFYGSYHSTKGNKIIHFIFIPLIAWATFILAAHAPLRGSHAITLAPGFAIQPNLALIFATFSHIYYFCLEPVAALFLLPVSLSFYTTATYLFSHPPSWLPGASSSLPFGWMLFATGWAAQFIGHAVFEGRTPALLEIPRRVRRGPR